MLTPCDIPNVLAATAAARIIARVLFIGCVLSDSISNRAGRLRARAFASASNAECEQHNGRATLREKFVRPSRTGGRARRFTSPVVTARPFILDPAAPNLYDRPS